LSPNPRLLEKALEIRKSPILYKNDEAILYWCETLGEDVQKFADVLENHLKLCPSYGESTAF
jgi:hypothetical protein